METKSLVNESCAKTRRAQDNIVMEEKWRTLEAEISEKWGKDLSADIVAAFRELYSIYKSDIVKWYANLFDPEIGGYYYSNSGRDTDKTVYNGKTYPLLPDLESTYQGDGFLYCSLVDTDVAERAPAWYAEKIVRFVKGLQNKENGYFYHPQWDKEEVDSKLSRRGRDLQWAVRLLERYGSSPTYDTPLGTLGDGLLADGTPADMNGAYRYVPATKEELERSKSYVAPHLVDKESFEKYLSGIEIGFEKNNTSYTIGNHFEAQGLQILARDKVLSEGGADYSLCDILKKWFDDRFYPETGLWCPSPRIDYLDVNGVLKITAAYNNIRRPLPDAAASMRAAISVILSDKSPGHVCSVLNPWYAISMISENVKKYTPAEDKEALSAKIEEILRELVSRYPEMIRATTRKLKLFQKPDGSFSYYENNTAFCSQGMPVAKGAVNEGDLNATNICQFGIVGHIFNSLGVRPIPIFTEADRLEYVNILEKNKKIK